MARQKGGNRDPFVIVRRAIRLDAKIQFNIFILCLSYLQYLWRCICIGPRPYGGFFGVNV